MQDDAKNGEQDFTRIDKSAKSDVPGTSIRTDTEFASPELLDADITRLDQPVDINDSQSSDSDETRLQTPEQSAKRLAHDAAIERSNVTGVTELQPGTVLKDRFVIEKVLGRGGMGVVYLALDQRKQEANDRSPYVALKALSDVYQRDEMMIRALQRESQKAQTLAHPNIATVYDFDRDGGIVYLTMEVLSGSAMDDFIRDHVVGVSPSRVAPIVRGLCLGMAYAHNKGIVHSDFKPGNVYLDDNDNPKVLDFGIARATPTSGTQMGEPSDVTQFDAGELGALTPSYAAKEMFAGADPHPADDVYAVAITIYELLTGRHPFQKKSAPQAEAEGLKPAPIIGLRRREWRAIRHGLAFNRADRQQHAADFLREWEGQSKLKLVVGLSVVMGLALVGYFGFVQVQEQARIAPDIPFTSLNGELQTQITQYVNIGQELEGFGDYQGALAQYRNAYELHPRNSAATDNIIKLMQKLTGSAIEKGDQSDLFDLLEYLEHLMETDGFLGTHETLKSLRNALEQS